MAKTKFKVDILSYSSDNEAILRAIAHVNEGKAELTLPDIQSYFYFKKAEWAAITTKWQALRDEDHDNILRISYDEGKTTSLIVEEIEVHQLDETPDPMEVLEELHNS